MPVQTQALKHRLEEQELSSAITDKISDAEVRFWTEVRTWTPWTELKVQSKVQSFCWTEPKVQFKVQPVKERFEPEPNFFWNYWTTIEFLWILSKF